MEAKKQISACMWRHIYTRTHTHKKEKKRKEEKKEVKGAATTTNAGDIKMQERSLTYLSLSLMDARA